MGSRSPHGKGIFEGQERPIVKYRDLPSMCGGDATSCQVTLTSCYYVPVFHVCRELQTLKAKFHYTLSWSQTDPQLVADLQ